MGVNNSLPQSVAEENMKYMKWSLLALLLAALVIVAAPTASAQSPFTLKVFDPSGATNITALHAPRLDTLEGKLICEVSYGLTWEAHRTFPLIRELLQKQFPTAKFVTDLPTGADMDSEEMANMVKEKGCQAAIVGNGG